MRGSRKRNIPQPIYITVEPTEKHDRLLIGRVGNYVAILVFLTLDKLAHLNVPESLYFMFGSAAAGLEIGQLVNLIKRK